AINQLMMILLLILYNRTWIDNNDFLARALSFFSRIYLAPMSCAPSSMIAITTTIILNKKAITIGIKLLSVKGYVRYDQPRGLILDKSMLDTSVPARIIYSKPTMLRDAPVADEEVGMI